MERERPAAPAWMIAAFLLVGVGAILLLANLGQIPPARLSWPLLVSLLGAAVVIRRPVRYLAFGGAVLAAGVLVVLHNVGTLPLGTHWPWLLVVAGALVVVDRLLARLESPRE